MPIYLCRNCRECAKENELLDEVVRLANKGAWLCPFWMCSFYDKDCGKLPVELKRSREMFEIGSVVFLNSGSPALEVIAVDGSLVTVEWRNDEGELQREAFFDACLTSDKSFGVVEESGYPHSPV
jgi:hypothetical protein